MKHRDRLQQFCRLLESAPVALTSVEPALLWERHVEDALTALPLLDHRPAQLCDVGSGGGSPGIPLALELDARPTLVEATTTKAEFLVRALAALEVDGDVVAARAEEYAAGLGRDRFPLVVARALARPPVALELCLPLVAPGGRCVLWTGDVTTTGLAVVARQLAAAVVRVEPTTAGRQLVVIEKLGPTPARFPRRVGVAGKRPLGSLR